MMKVKKMMKTTKILEKEIIEIEKYGPSNLLVKIDQCNKCKNYFYRIDMIKIGNKFNCIECKNIFMKRG